MTDANDEPRARPVARMALEPDALHASGATPYVDCPQCGSRATITRILDDGRCSGHLDADATETGDDAQLQDPDCTAKLSLELVWEA